MYRSNTLQNVIVPEPHASETFLETLARVKKATLNDMSKTFVFEYRAFLQDIRVDIRIAMNDRKWTRS